MCDISSLRVNGTSEPGRLRDVCVCQWVNLSPYCNQSHNYRYTSWYFLERICYSEAAVDR